MLQLHRQPLTGSSWSYRSTASLAVLPVDSDCTLGSPHRLSLRTAAARARAGAPGPSPAGGRALSPPLTLHGVSVGLLPQRIPRCLPRGLGLHAGIAARIAPSDCSSAGLRWCAVSDAGGCRFPPSSAPHRVFVELLQHCIPRCPPRGHGLHAGIAAKTEPPDCRSAGPRRCAVPSMAAAAFPTVNPPQGLCGATAALHPWLASPWTRTARRVRRSACAWGCPGHWWQDERLLLSRGLGPSRRLRHARPEGGSYLGAAPLRVWPDGPPSSPPSTWRWCCLRHAASKREPDRDGPPWEARAFSPPHLDGGLLCGGRLLELEVPYCFWPAVP